MIEKSKLPWDGCIDVYNEGLTFFFCFWKT